MGEPAEMSAGDRTITVELAKFIRENVVQDKRTPSSAILEASTRKGIPIDTLILWLAQYVLEPTPRVKVRGVDFACEDCGQLAGSHLHEGWYRCANCGYPGK